MCFGGFSTDSSRSTSVIKHHTENFSWVRNFEDKFWNNSDRTRRLTYTKYKINLFYLHWRGLSAPVVMAINSINTLRTRLCLGICSKWLKMKLVNISLYTVIDNHEYREILETGGKGCRRQIGSSHLPADWLFTPLLCWLERFPGLCGTNTVIRTVERRSQVRNLTFIYRNKQQYPHFRASFLHSWGIPQQRYGPWR